jgi:hypothetical protein
LYLGYDDHSGIDILQLENLLDLAVFPSLEQYRYGSIDSFFPNSALSSLFSRSHCRLTHFHLFGDLENGTSDKLISILSGLPTVTHLKLEESESRPPEDVIMSDELLQKLTPNRFGEFAHTDQLLPRLKSLEFLGYKAFSWSCLASLVSTTTSDGSSNVPGRQGAENSILHISFRVYFRGEREFIDAHSVAQFKGGRDAGISITIVNERRLYTFLSPSFDAADDATYPFDLLP